MAENINNEILLMNKQLEQLQKQLDELTTKHLHLSTIVEQLQMIHSLEIKQVEHDQSDVQVPPSLDKNKEVATFTKENRSFIQSIWKRKKEI